MRTKAKIGTLLSAMFFLVALFLFLFVGWPAIHSPAHETAAVPATGGGGTGLVGAKSTRKSNKKEVEEFECILPDPDLFNSHDELDKLERDNAYWLKHYQGDLVEGEIVRPADLYPVEPEDEKIIE